MEEERAPHEDNEQVSEAEEIIPTDSPSENVLVREHLRDMPNIIARGLVYIILLLLVVLFLYSVLARIDIVAECGAIARPASHVIKIISDRNGYVENVFIAEGDTVKEDSPLFLLRSKETVSYASKVNELTMKLPIMEENFDIKISSAEDRLKQRTELNKNTMTTLGLKTEQSDLSLESIEHDLSNWRSEVELVTKEFELVKKGLETGYASVLEYNNVLSDLGRAKTEVEKLESQKQITLRERQILDNEKALEQSEYMNEKAQLEKEIANLKLDKESSLQSLRSELEMNRKLLEIQRSGTSDTGAVSTDNGIVRAEKGGIVSELYFRNPGEYVSVSDLMCTLVPVDSPLYADIVVSNKDIGFIEAGMKVKYKFDAFPYSDYGMLNGTVETIAPSAVEDPVRGYVYHIRGTFDQPYYTIRNRIYPLKTGMTAAAEIVTERKSIFSLLFRKLQK